VQLPSGYVNFYFRGIIIVTVVGFAFVATALLFERIASWIAKRRGSNGFTEWLESGQFQRLKREYENEGIGGRENEDKDFLRRTFLRVQH